MGEGKGEWVERIALKHVYWSSLVTRMVKKSDYNVGDLGSIPGLRRSPGEGNDHPVQYYWLENSTDLLPYVRQITSSSFDS